MAPVTDYTYRFDYAEAKRRATRTLEKPSRDDHSLVRTLSRDVLALIRERDDFEQRLHAYQQGER